MARTVAGPLGDTIDIGVCVNLQDLCGISTQVQGNPISCDDCKGVLFVLVAGDGNGTTDDLQWDLQEVDGAAGTPRDLDAITKYWYKSHASALDGTAQWTEVTQVAGSEVSAIAGTQELVYLVAFAVDADQLSSGYTHLAIRQPDLGSTDSKYGTWIAIKYGLKEARDPANLAAVK